MNERELVEHFRARRRMDADRQRRLAAIASVVPKGATEMTPEIWDAMLMKSFEIHGVSNGKATDHGSDGGRSDVPSTQPDEGQPRGVEGAHAREGGTAQARPEE
jgi:hypothetical protein